MLQSDPLKEQHFIRVRAVAHMGRTALNCCLMPPGQSSRSVAPMRGSSSSMRCLRMPACHARTAAAYTTGSTTSCMGGPSRAGFLGPTRLKLCASAAIKEDRQAFCCGNALPACPGREGRVSLTCACCAVSEASRGMGHVFGLSKRSHSTGRLPVMQRKCVSYLVTGCSCAAR